MFNFLTNVAKAAVAVAVTPVTVAADILTLPQAAIDDTDVFARTGKKLDQAGQALDAALKPEKD